MVQLTKAQRSSLFQAYQRGGIADEGVSYRQFRRTVQPGFGCVLVRWCGMWLGIEPDGYRHT